MRSPLVLLLVLGLVLESHAEPDFPLTEDSKVHADIPHGDLITGTYIAKEGSVFPGTVRDYTIYIPPGCYIGKSSPFMVFQDGVIYDAPVVFDNLIAKKQIPPLIGIFIKPGVVPAANPNANPRLNRCYEYDSVTDTYARFLIDELLPAIAKKHELALSTDPDDAAIAGNSSGGICAFMVGWHRPDRIRRIFSGVGTYVGIRGGDQLPVLIRKYEPKPLRVFLQSGTNDNNLYCGDWWMANQMMERSLTWNGYDVNHVWGEGGHNQKHASQIFPDVMRWLWRDFDKAKQIKANAEGKSKWKGYEVIGDGKWELATNEMKKASSLTAKISGDVFALDYDTGDVWKLSPMTAPSKFATFGVGGDHGLGMSQMVACKNDKLVGTGNGNTRGMSVISNDGNKQPFPASSDIGGWSLCLSFDGWFYMSRGLTRDLFAFPYAENDEQVKDPIVTSFPIPAFKLTLSPDQSVLYVIHDNERMIWSYRIMGDHSLRDGQAFYELQSKDNGAIEARGLCVDTNGWLYVATALGIQVCDTSGRVNFIIPTPQPPHDVCFGGKDLGELFIACGDKIYKRPTKAHGYVSGQMAPIKPPTPKL